MKRIAAPTGIALALLAVYIWTMAPGNFWIDSAAFATCNQILGLPHSPSFPLYTVMGRVLHMLLPVTPAFASNLYSALAAAAAGVILYLIFMQILMRLPINSSIKYSAAVTGALCAALTLPVWQSAVRAEVYSLQLVLSLLVVHLFLASVTARPADRRLRYALGMVFIQGLSFANHSLLAFITLPLLLAMPVFFRPPAGRSALVRAAAVATVLFLVAITAYTYLPIRASRDPAVNSGQPRTLAATIDVVTRGGEDYLPAGPPGNADYGRRAKLMLRFLYDQTGGLVLLGLIAGLIFVIREKQRPVLIMSALVPVGLAVTLWAADFTLYNFDIVAYTGLPLVLIIVLAWYGLCRFAGRFFQRRAMSRLIPMLFGLLVIFQLSGNLYSADLSGTAGPDRLAEAILADAPPDAVLIVNEDNVLLPLWYHCYAMGKRPDLAVISAGALYRPAYRDHIRRQYPHLKYPPSFDRYRIESLGDEVASFCDLNFPTHPILVQFGAPGVDAGRLLPGGFLFRYNQGRDGAAAAVDYPLLELLECIADGATDLLTREFVARAAFNFGVYYDRRGRSEKAYRFFAYAVETDDENPEYLLRLGVAFMKAGRRDEGIMLLKQAAATGDGCPEAEAILARLTARDDERL